MFLVIGLGNPGRRYELTRHNVGFLAIDALAARTGTSADRAQLGALVGSVRVDGESFVLAKPQSFMNLSGQPAASLRGFYKPEDDAHIIVIHDDVDLPFGEVRLKEGGGHGGHNGLRDLQAKLGTNHFIRVRVGVGRPREGWETADWVLAPFDSEEQAELPAICDRAASAVLLVASRGIQAAMNEIHTRSEPKRAGGASTSR